MKPISVPHGRCPPVKSLILGSQNFRFVDFYQILPLFGQGRRSGGRRGVPLVGSSCPGNPIIETLSL